MNEPIAYLPDATAVKQPVCSEKKCITCFENRGCMYEQYMTTAAQTTEESYPVQQSIVNYSLQKGFTA